MSEAPTEQEPSARIKPVVFYGSAAVTLAVALWAIITPTAAATTIGGVVGWISEWFGWFYILLATLILIFVIFVGASRLGRTRLGPEHAQPEFGTFAWASMLFAAGIGTDLMFFAVVEPVTQYLDPPRGQGQTLEAAREAVVWSMFHYGITGWGMYALMGMALAYFAYRRGLPLAVRSALYPIFGKRIHGRLGDSVDLATVLGTIFGVATTLGIGVVLLNYGLNFLFGIPEGTAAQVGLVVIAIVMATVSAVSGVDRGIKLLSQLNVLLAIGLALYLLIVGDTVFLLNGLVVNVGDFVSSFPSLTMETFAYDRPVDWLNAWTLFFWAWWIAWASFVGLFLARISRGRTIRQFVAGTLIIPFSYIVMWMSLFGNSAIATVRANPEFGQNTVENNAQGFYQLLAQYPGVAFTASVATFVGLLFYVTSADSSALVMANLTSHLKTAESDGPPWMRIFWAVATGLLTVGMLLVGGVPALQSATIIMGLPFAFVMLLVMYGLYKALRLEAMHVDSQQNSLQSFLSGRSTPDTHRPDGRSWRHRLDRVMSVPGSERAEEFLTEVALPAVQEVATHLQERGVQAQAHQESSEDGTTFVELVADLGEEHPFRYQIRPREAPIPVYGPAVPKGTDTYCRLEVHLREGGQGYNVMGYTHGQLIDDVLDQYERHLEFVRMQQAADT